MRALFDTSIFYPALIPQHPKHRICAELLGKFNAEHEILILSTHLVAELYANMTRTPEIKISPDDARRILRQLANKFEEVSLTMDDYLRAVDRCADADLISGVIYDALHFQAAVKAKVDVLYTGNVRDFDRLLTPDVTSLIKSPY